jgi:hypothetical protein
MARLGSLVVQESTVWRAAFRRALRLTPRHGRTLRPLAGWFTTLPRAYASASTPSCGSTATIRSHEASLAEVARRPLGSGNSGSRRGNRLSRACHRCVGDYRGNRHVDRRGRSESGPQRSGGAAPQGSLRNLARHSPMLPGALKLSESLKRRASNSSRSMAIPGPNSSDMAISSSSFPSLYRSPSRRRS